MQQLLTLLFLGPQGSGKGTHVELLQKYLTERDPTREALYFEAGKNLRAFAEEDNYTARLAKEEMARGELVPTFLSTYVFSKKMIAHMKPEAHLMIDGFPRTHDQLPILDTALRFYKREHPTVINISISDEEAMKRLLLRARADDTQEGIKKRLSWTREEEKNIHDWFKNNSAYRFVDIQGEQTIEAVHADIMKVLNLA